MSSHRIDRYVVLFAFFFIGRASLVTASSRKLPLAPESTLWLVGDSTLHSFTSRTTVLQLTTDMELPGIPDDASTQDIFNAIVQRQALKQLDLSIPVKGLTSKDSALDKNMYTALKTGECSSIDFHMAHYDMLVATSSTTGARVRVTGTLRVACDEQPVTLEGTLTQEGDILRIQGQYPLLMTDYGVKPPTFMMGAMKVKNPVMIHFDLRLEARPT